jgi:hypothetical protein
MTDDLSLGKLLSECAGIRYWMSGRQPTYLRTSTHTATQFTTLSFNKVALNYFYKNVIIMCVFQLYLGAYM